MIYENMELHNIAELVKVQNQPGLRMQRVPESVRERLEEPAQNKTLNPAGAEIRFVLNGERARIMLSSSDVPGTARLFYGPFGVRLPVTVIEGEPTVVEVAPSETGGRLGELPEAMAAEKNTTKATHRILFIITLLLNSVIPVG